MRCFPLNDIIRSLRFSVIITTFGTDSNYKFIQVQIYMVPKHAFVRYIKQQEKAICSSEILGEEI
jgi:hypothetical protein